MALKINKTANEYVPAKLVLAVVLTLLFAGALLSYTRFFITQDYPVSAKVDCDPAVESCYVYVCDQGIEECTGNPNEDTSYYKILTKFAEGFGICIDGECPDISCGSDDVSCEIVHCDPDAGEECVGPDPETFGAPEEDGVETDGAELPQETENTESGAGEEMSKKEPSTEQATESTEGLMKEGAAEAVSEPETM